MSKIWRPEETIFAFNKFLCKKYINNDLEDIAEEFNILYNRNGKRVRTGNSMLYRFVLLYCLETDGYYEKGNVRTEIVNIKKLIDNNEKYNHAKNKILKDYKENKYKDIKILYDKIYNEIIKDELEFGKIKEIVSNNSKEDNIEFIKNNNNNIDTTNNAFLDLIITLNKRCDRLEEKCDKLEKDNKMMLTQLRRVNYKKDKIIY